MAQTDEVAAKISQDDLLALVAREFEIDLGDLCRVSKKRNLTEGRGVAAWLVAKTGQHTLAELARCMHRDPSALSLQAKKVRERAMKETQFRQKLDKLKSDSLHNNSITDARPFATEYGSELHHEKIKRPPFLATAFGVNRLSAVKKRITSLAFP